MRDGQRLNPLAEASREGSIRAATCEQLVKLAQEYRDQGDKFEKDAEELEKGAAQQAGEEVVAMRKSAEAAIAAEFGNNEGFNQIVADVVAELLDSRLRDRFNGRIKDAKTKELMGLLSYNLALAKAEGRKQRAAGAREYLAQIEKEISDRAAASEATKNPEAPKDDESKAPQTGTNEEAEKLVNRGEATPGPSEDAPAPVLESPTPAAQPKDEAAPKDKGVKSKKDKQA